jgi:two-component system, chemotaxis family, response regulator Rcp1
MRPDLLIVDDAKDQIELMRAVFNMVDPSLNIISALDGDAAIRLLRSRPEALPTVILLDLKMPRKSGHEILSELKVDPALRQIPVCTFSSSDFSEDVRESYLRGASFYFKKPAGIEQLMKFAHHFKGLWFDFAAHAN